AGNPASEATQSLSVAETAPSISIGAINSGNPVNATEASNGFAIGGSTSGVEDGQTVTVHILSGATSVDTFTTTVTSNAWSLTVPSSDHLADGSYTVTADVSNKAGNPASEATQSLSVAETAPSISIGAINSGNPVNATEASNGFAIGGSTSGVEDGQTVTVHILSGATSVDTFTTTVTSNAWSLTVPSSDHLA